MSLEDRKGVFYLSSKKFYSNFGQWYDDVSCVLEQVVVIRCEHMVITDNFEYHAYSHHFDKLNTGEKVKIYTPLIKYTGDNHPLFVGFEIVKETPS